MSIGGRRTGARCSFFVMQTCVRGMQFFRGAGTRRGTPPIAAFAAIGPRLDESVAGADGSDEIDALRLHHLVHQRLLAERAGELRPA